MKIHSDYLDTYVGGKYDFDNDQSFYNFEDVFIPCKEKIIIKISDEDRHHTIAVDCSTRGHQKLSFKLGRFVIDATEEEFKGHAGEEESYSLESGDEAEIFKRKEAIKRPAKFVV